MGRQSVSAKTLERLVYLLAFAIAAAPFTLPYFGILGGQKFSARLSVAIFVLALICGAFVSQERKKIEAVRNDAVRRVRERGLARKIGFVGVALAAALLCGYLIGQQF